MAKTIADLKPVTGKWYKATFHEPTGQLRIVVRNSQSYLFLPLVSAVDQGGRRDETQGLSDVQARARGGTTVVTFTEKNALWDRKEYTIEFRPGRITYRYKVFGQGEVSRAHFFRSWFKDPTTVEEELGVVPGFDTVFSPSVNFWGKTYHFPGDTSIITAGDEPTYWGAGLVAAPYCFGFNRRGEKPWVWAGLGVRAGQYLFDEFNWNTNQTRRIFGAGGFDCNYAGKLRIDGSWASPDLVLGIANDPYKALEDYVGVLEEDYGLKLPRKRNIPTWWRSPIFCGWGEQMSLGYRDHGNVEGVSAGAYCTQALHDRWMGIFRKHKIRPGMIIIDAGWQAAGTAGDMVVDPKRWPDLRGWIEARQAEGIKVILWMTAWSRAGVPDDECLTKDGKPFNVDPTNPKYEARMRAMIRRLLGREEGGYNADGLKVDGQLLCPVGPGLKNQGDIWGLELQRRWLSIVYSEAKKLKPDAAVGAFQANPYVADLCDTTRTADLFSLRGDPTDTMVHRARILSIAMPGCPIDTDHAYWYDVRDNWIDIMPAQLPVGIPCAYHAEYVWHKHPFMRPYIETMTDEHYKVIRKVFDAQWKKIQKRK